MNFPVDVFYKHKTPFYFYDMSLLKATLGELKAQIADMPYHVHYAVKANANGTLLGAIRDAGLGADCVSGWEVKADLPATKLCLPVLEKPTAKLNMHSTTTSHASTSSRSPNCA